MITSFIWISNNEIQKSMLYYQENSRASTYEKLTKKKDPE